MPPPLVEIERLTVPRPHGLALDSVSLSVAQGSLHAVVGPNGAGKSTLIAALLGQVPFSGTVRFHFRGSGRIGFVPQRFEVDRTLPVTVGDFLAAATTGGRPVCLGIGRRGKQRATEALARVGLAGFEKRLLGALSGGEAQRVLLGNALTPEPELLILDEPAQGLDAASSKRLEADLRALREEGKVTVLLVSHDLEQVRDIADRVTVLQGKVVADGAPLEILAAGAR